MNNETEKTEAASDCKPLLELATPNIYRRNLFRVLGLPVNASSKDVQRQQARRKMQDKLGLGKNGSSSPLALAPSANEHDVRLAMERLNRPMDRVLDEIFWFWPLDGESTQDPGLQFLEQGNVELAKEFWLRNGGDSQAGCMASHNLAVLDQLIALDREADAKQADPEVWQGIFGRWKQVFDAEDFWSAVRNRIRLLNDVQVPTGFVRRIRSSLPMALLLINAKIACSAAERSDKETAQRHLGIIRSSNFGDDLVEQAIGEALKPVRERIRTAAENARNRWTAAPQQGNRHVRDLHEQGKKMLAIVDSVLPASDPTLAGLHDLVADAMLDGQIAFGNRTNEWAEAMQLLELAQELAVGETQKGRLTKNLDILKENAKSGNDWCSPGYWDLPEDVVAQLEAARDKSRAGDHEGAVKNLLVVDPKIGAPLRRCVAFALRGRSVQIFNQAQEAQNQLSGKLKELWDKLVAMSDLERTLALFQKPDPSPYSVNPPCMCCGSTYYRSWMNFKFRDIPLWWCSSCNSEDDRQRESRKSAFLPEVIKAAEFIALAHEIDPKEKAIEKDFKFFKDKMAELKGTFPKTTELKARLGAARTRGMRRDHAAPDADEVCFFCGNGSAEPSCQIVVPMCGDVRQVDLLFNQGFEYGYSDIAVPRCRRCRDEHQNLLGRRKSWQEARLAVAVDGNFFRETRELDSAQKAAREADKLVETHIRAVAHARAALGQAEAIGTKCGKCGTGTPNWDGSACKSCDSALCGKFKLTKWDVPGIPVVAFVLAVAAVVFGAPTSAFFMIFGLLCFPGWIITLPIYAFAKRGIRWQKLRDLRTKRLAETKKQRVAAVNEAKVNLEHETATLEEARRAAVRPHQAVEYAKGKLNTAKAQATTVYERTRPAPRLADGIRAEEEFTSFRRITELRSRSGGSWGFGRKISDDGKVPAGDPVEVTGLVGPLTGLK